jgi:hypothetical protein
MDHSAVHAGVIPFDTNNSFHHFRISRDCVWVEVNHDASLILHGNLYSCSAFRFTKHQGSAHPLVFLEWRILYCFEDNIGSKSANVEVTATFALDATHRT